MCVGGGEERSWGGGGRLNGKFILKKIKVLETEIHFTLESDIIIKNNNNGIGLRYDGRLPRSTYTSSIKFLSRVRDPDVRSTQNETTWRSSCAYHSHVLKSFTTN